MAFDVQFKTHVCVIGAGVRDGLFGTADPVNKNVSIGRTRFRVIGVMEKQGGSSFGGPNFDRQIFVPITSFVKAFGGDHGRQDVDVAVKAPAQEALRDLEFTVIGEMRKIRGLRPSERDNFSINKLDTLVGTFNNIMGVVLLVGLLVTGISLFVGAVGLMNIMLVSVTERTREIGIRKAIGATKHAILYQFLVEALVLCLVGGLVGVLFGSLGAIILSRLAHCNTLISPLAILLAFAFSAAVGLFFGIWPARRAAALDPILALRYE